MNWEILLKHINNETTVAEELEVNAWLNEQAENKHLLQYLQKRGGQLKQPLPAQQVQDEWEHLLDKMFDAQLGPKIPRYVNTYKYLGIAASVLMVSLLSWYYLSPAKQASQGQQYTMQTPANMRGKVTLPDGTLVYLAPHSSVKYNNSFGVNKRIVSLTGEAFFNVKHNTHKPFIIHAENGVALTVLGTSFNFYSHKNEVAEVKVASGLVGVTANKHTYFLKAGQQLSYRTQNRQAAITEVDLNDAAALQNETLYFKNNTAKEIAVKLQRWYNINVSVQPSALTRPRFSGEMKDTGIANLLKGLSYATGIKYRYQNSNSILLF